MDKSTQDKENAEQRIFDAAQELFVQKGLHGARMQEIADKAGINKALLHYYFRSKEKLFEAVIKVVIRRAIPVISNLLEADMPLKEKLDRFLEFYINLISKNTYIPLFLLTEMHKKPKDFLERILPHDLPRPDAFFKQVEAEIAAGNIRKVDPRHLIVNVISLSIFPFVGKPMEQALLRMSDDEMKDFLKQRKAEVREFVLASLRP